MSEYRNMSTSKHQDYNQDFYAWAMESAELIRQRRFSEIDIENVAEELEGVAKADKRELVNRMAILLSHLLKWQFQVGRRSSSWSSTIMNQRFEIAALLEDSPSLKYQLEQKFGRAYQKAVMMAARQMRVAISKLPVDTPFSLAECLDVNFLPE